MKKRFSISAGHEYATEIAETILASGGNVVDAGVASCMALCVLHSEQVQFGGISPVILKQAGSCETKVIDGVGRWPAAATPELFLKKFRGRIPVGIMRTVVPGSLAAWIIALSHYGTRSFAELAEPARDLAKKGFPAHEDLVRVTTEHIRHLTKYPQNSDIWLIDGAPVQLGQTVTYPDLATMLDRLINEDSRARRVNGREAGLQAVLDLFYRGPMAAQMLSHVEEHGGLLTRADLANPGIRIENSIVTQIPGGALHTCGPWSQGPAVSQALMILAAQFKDRCVSEATFAHTVIEAMKLTLADREAFYGDPDFMDVPLETLLTPVYAAQRAKLIDQRHAYYGLPAPGLKGGWVPAHPNMRPRAVKSLDTSVISIVDEDGNVFSSTPSDQSLDGPAVPGLGFVMSTRGAQSFTEAGHPSIIAPHKRPRVTANPLIYLADDGRILAGGGPGGDNQIQAMVQVLARYILIGQSLSEALSAPRIFTQSAPTSSAPHLSFPGRISAEEGWDISTLQALSGRGHSVTDKPSPSHVSGVYLVQSGPESGDWQAHSDPRKANSAKILLSQDCKEI